MYGRMRKYELMHSKYVTATEIVILYSFAATYELLWKPEVL